VIIPTFNAGDSLIALLERIRSQTLAPVEIIVVDSGSCPQPRSVLESLRVKLITIPPGSFDHGGTRNLAAEEARGNVIIFMTQDALPVDSLVFEKLVEPLFLEDVVVTYARQLAAQKAALAEKYLRLNHYPPQSVTKNIKMVSELGIRTFQNSNVCAAYRKQEFKELGCFPAPVVCNEDMLYAAKAIYAGYSVVYNAEAQVWHTHYYSYSKLFKRYFDIAASLDNDERIRSVGKVEQKGFAFLVEQINYVRDQKKHHEIPRTLLEAAFKYLGYKCGEHHNRIPPKLKKYLGLNRAYWVKMELTS
jgi:rhamnosyltransferase